MLVNELTVFLGRHSSSGVSDPPLLRWFSLRPPVVRELLPHPPQDVSISNEMLLCDLLSGFPGKLGAFGSARVRVAARRSGFGGMNQRAARRVVVLKRPLGPGGLHRSRGAGTLVTAPQPLNEMDICPFTTSVHQPLHPSLPAPLSLVMMLQHRHI